MRLYSIALCVWVTIFLAVPASAKRKPNTAALTLFRKAIQSSDIEGQGGTAFRLQAQVRVFLGVGNESEGMAIEFWVPGNLRRETLLNGYSRLEVFKDKQKWVKSSAEYSPFPAPLIWTALNPAAQLEWTLQQPVTYVPFVMWPHQGERSQIMLKTPKAEGGGSEQCVEVVQSSGPAREKSLYCFQSATGYLVSITGGMWDLSYQYADYQPFGSKYLPRAIQVYYHDGQQLMDLQIATLGPTPNAGPNLFQPPPGSQEAWTTACGKGVPTVTGGKLIKQVMPVYPDDAKRRRIEGKVETYAVIGKDGIPHSLWLLESPSSELTAAAWGAFQQWRYRPATLCGQEINVETVITVMFELGP